MLTDTSSKTTSFFKQNQSDIENMIFTGAVTTVCAAMAFFMSDKIAGVGAFVFGGATAAYAESVYKAFRHKPE